MRPSQPDRRRLAQPRRASAVLVLLALVVAACSGDDDTEVASDAPQATSTTSGGSGAEEDAVEKVGLVSTDPLEESDLLQPSVTPSSSALLIWTAIDKGLFKKHGLNINYVDAPSSRATDLYMAGEFKFGWTLPSQVPAAISVDKPIDVYAIDADKYAYGFYVLPEIKSLDDLAGKRVGISGSGGNPHVATLKLFADQGFDAESVVFQETGGVSDILTAMLTGEVAAGAFGPPSSVVAEREGMTKLYDLTTMDLPTVQTLVVGDPAWVEANPNTARAWMRAFLEAAWMTRADKQVAFEVLAQRLKLDQSKPEDVETLEAAYEVELAVRRPPEEMGEIVDFLTVIKEEYPEPDRVGDIGVAAPDVDLVADLVEEGFFERLQEEYGPVEGRD